MISISNNFLFIHVPKTGGNSVQSVLLPFCDDYKALLNPRHDGEERFEIRSKTLDIHKHSSLEEYRLQLDPDLFERLIKVTCARNPWDRCISFFHSPHRGDVSWSEQAFEEFIIEKIKPHRDFLQITGGAEDAYDNVDVNLRHETLQADFELFCQKIGINAPSLPTLNVSSRKHYRDYYTSERLINLVAERYADDIKRFGYTF